DVVEAGGGHDRLDVQVASAPEAVLRQHLLRRPASPLLGVAVAGALQVVGPHEADEPGREAAVEGSRHMGEHVLDRPAGAAAGGVPLLGSEGTEEGQNVFPFGSEGSDAGVPHEYRSFASALYVRKY